MKLYLRIPNSFNYDHIANFSNWRKVKKLKRKYFYYLDTDEIMVSIGSIQIKNNKRIITRKFYIFDSFFYNIEPNMIHIEQPRCPRSIFSKIHKSETYEFVTHVSDKYKNKRKYKVKCYIFFKTKSELVKFKLKK